MLPTFVIGLREALEASLIVGIIAAFLNRNGRRDLMRWVMIGVAAAIVLCAAGGVGLYLLSADLPQKQQEGLETVIGAIAVGMVTYMVVWMKRHSRDLKKQLEGAANTALAEGSAWALVGMAFLAVLREGFETAVFLVAAFNGATSRGEAGGGALLGVALAVVLGYGIYRGGVRLNLSKFFRFTGFVLVLVAAGLVQTAFRTAHEAGWLNIGQQATVDLSSVVAPGSVQSALITGMLGIQPQPRLIEFVAWLLYLVPVGLYVAWPQGRGLARRTTAVVVAASAVAVGVVAGALALVAPSVPSAPTSLTAAITVPSGAGTTGGSASGGGSAGDATVDVAGLPAQLRVSAVDPLTGDIGPVTTLAATASGPTVIDGVNAVEYQASLPATTSQDTLTYAQIAERNGGRLPLGVRPTNDRSVGEVPVTTTSTTSVTVALSTDSQQIVNAVWTSQSVLTAQSASGAATIRATPVTAGLADDVRADAVASAKTAADNAGTRAAEMSAAVLLGVVAGLLLIIAAIGYLWSRRPVRRAEPIAVSSVAPAAASPAAAARTKTV